jgi:Uma2 family endonuclease
MATIPRILTYEEWLQMPPAEDGSREEVVNGELLRLPPNKYVHSDVIQCIIDAFWPRIDRKQIKILGSSVTLLISAEPLASRAPDLLIYWRKDIVRDVHDLLCSPPGLLIEVLSPSETKRRKQAKLDDYAKIGVPEVWIVSPEAESIDVLLLKDGRYERAEIVVAGELRPTRFPDVSIPIGEIWPE